MKYSRISAAALAVMMAAAMAPAAYATMDETLVRANVERKVAYVSYADLNLGDPANVDALQDRVRRAATRICIDNNNRDLKLAMHGRACRDAAIDNAAPRIAAAIANSGNARMASRPPIAVTQP